MGTTLTGKKVQNTYDSLLKLSDNDNLTTTAKIVGDGLGNNSPIYLSTSKVGINVTPTFEFQTNSHAKIGGDLTVGGNFTVNGTTTIVDSTVIAIGDNMMEMAKDNSSNTMDIGWYGTINSSGEKYVGVFYDASSGVATPEFHIGLGTVEPSSTAAWTVKGKLVIGALDATTGVFSGQVTIPATPVASTDAASKSYVDAQITAQDLDIAGDSGTGAVDLDSQTFTISGGTNVTTSVSGQTVTINASGGIDGSGTANDVVMWQDSDTLTDAPIAISGNDATFAGNVISLDTFYLQNGSGKRWQMLFDTNAFNLRYYNGSSWSADALAIDTSNNATFAGSVGVGIAPAATFQVKVATNVNFTTSNNSGDLRLNAVNDAIDATVPLEFNATNYEFLGTGATTFAGNIRTGTSTLTANTNFDNLVIEGAAHTGITIFSGTSSDGAIYFGDSDANNLGQIKYLHSSNAMTFATNDGSPTLTLDSSTNATFAGNVVISGGDGLKINTTSDLQTSSEKFSLNGLGVIRNSSDSAATLYIQNHSTTTSTIQPYIFLADSGGNRGALGVETSTAKVTLNGQGGIRFTTGSSGVGGTEAIFIDTSQGSTFAGVVKGNSYFSAESTGNAYIRFKHSTGGLNYVGSSESLASGFGDENDMLNYSVSGKWGVYTNSALALTIDESQNANFAGNVTAGSSSSSKKFRAYHSDGSYMDLHGYGVLFNRTASYIRPTADGTHNMYFGYSADGYDWNNIVFNYTGYTSFIGANVGIGTTSPDAQLEIEKSASGAVGPTLLLNNSAGGGGDKANIIFASFGNTYQRAKIEFKVSSETNNPGNIDFYTGRSDLGTLSQKMTILGNGEIGVGVTPESWTLFTPIQIGQASSFVGRTSLNQTDVCNNWYYDGAEKRINTGYAQRYVQDSSGDHYWLTGGTSSADSAISWSQVMTIKNNGNVGIGTTGPSYPLQVERTSNGVVSMFKVSDGTNNPRLLFYGDASGSHIQHTWSANATNLIFEVGGSEGAGTERMRIDSSGNVSLATATSLDFNVADFAQIKFKESGAITIDSDNNQSSRNFQFKDGDGSSLMFIGDDGKIGIGTTSPSSFNSRGRNLVVSGSGNVGISIDSASTGSGTILFADGTGGTAGYRGIIEYDHSTDSMEFSTAATERMRIDNSGNVGIGTDSPAAKLDVRNAGQGGIELWPEGLAVAGTNLINNYDRTGDNFVDFEIRAAQYNWKIGTSSKMVMLSSGNVGIGTTSPSFLLHVVGDQDILKIEGSGASGPQLRTFDSSTASDGDIFGLIDMAFKDSAGNETIGNRIKSVVNDVTNGTEDTSLEFFTLNDANSTKALTLDYLQNALFTAKVGIGTTAPVATYQLTIEDSSTAGIALSDTGQSGDYQFAANGDLCYWRYNGDNSKGIFLKNAGNVGIGTTSPNAGVELEVNGIISANGDQSPTGGGLGFGDYQSGGYKWIQSFESQELRINPLGNNVTFPASNVGIGTTSVSYKLDVTGQIRATDDIIAFSDIRVKENVKTLENSLNKVNKLRGVEFNKIGNNNKSIGVIAQEIEKILPEVVHTDNEGMKSVAYGNITGLLIEAVKELSKEVQELKNQIK